MALHVLGIDLPNCYRSCSTRTLSVLLRHLGVVIRSSLFKRSLVCRSVKVAEDGVQVYQPNFPRAVSLAQ